MTGFFAPGYETMDTESPRPLRLHLFDWLRRQGRTRRDLMREMEELIEEGTAEGVLNEDEEEMLLSVLSFRKLLVREVMVPRTQMACCDAAANLDEVVAVMLEEGHSRIPVYEATWTTWWGSSPPGTCCSAGATAAGGAAPLSPS